MGEQATVVLDVGKTLTKLSLWAPDGRLIAQCNRPNERVDTGAYVALDAAGIESVRGREPPQLRGTRAGGGHHPRGPRRRAQPFWTTEAAWCCRRWTTSTLFRPRFAQAYDEQRDPFAFTGSPALPDGLNLGAQLFFLESLHPGLLSGQRRIVPWAQYWSWVLSGVAASEVTSLGCHTDLWRPLARGRPRSSPSSRGWSDHFAPLHDAGSVLGTLRPEWVKRTGLSPKVRVYCGLHDSNAALVAARASAELSEQEATILSTGTWFVAMRTPGARGRVSIAGLDEKRDCLVNVDVGRQSRAFGAFHGWTGDRAADRSRHAAHRHSARPACPARERSRCACEQSDGASDARARLWAVSAWPRPLDFDARVMRRIDAPLWRSMRHWSRTRRSSSSARASDC